MRRIIPTLLVATAACGGSDDTYAGLDLSLEVSELSDADQVKLFETYLDTWCAIDPADEECTTCDALALPTFHATMDTECAGVTVGEVKVCMDAIAAEDPAAASVCGTGGGCVFDVPEAICSPEAR